MFPQTVGPKWVRKVMPWIETFWHSKRRYPLDDELIAKFGFTPQQLLQMHSSKFYQNALDARGITRVQSDLSEQQVAAISLITNFSDRRSSEVKMSAIGVTPEQLNGWYQNPAFQTELAARADSVLENSYPEVQAQLIRQIKAGSFPALKFYYEVTGRAQSPETINVKMAMMRMIEIIQRHVQDPAVLQAIANEMRGVVGPVAGSTTVPGNEVVSIE